MHPILSKKGRLGPYLLLWLPPAGMLAYVLGASGELGWREAVALAPPLAAAYAFVCLGAWYLCRAVPLKTSRLWRLVGTNLAAAVAAAALWAAAGKALAQGLARTGSFPRLDERLERQAPVLVGMGVLFFLLAVAFHYVLLAQDASREAAILARDSELKALKTQLNPHFLFNSLHSISALTTADPARAREMCVRLADFLRRTLGLGEKDRISLAEELSLVRSYLEVERVRFGKRLELEESIGEGCLGCLVPPLVLQPLVENAVKHGIAGLVQGGRIAWELRLAGAVLHVRIENDYDPEAPPPRASGIGLANVRARLQARYGAAARLDVSAGGGRFRAELALPAETGEEQ